ncbi:hypothetical protein SteCoe_30132 [Stentor coeruleus]|uniref:Upf1 domain-containing protein n=1 Tax=Stentor coeruleus TaxID=5963 RepID=A0A1R2B4B9_9CILI|nr:hypothetical protein SteCoe_30132 [Stentor coeruleus]
MEIREDEIITHNIFHQGIPGDFSSLPNEHCLYCGVCNPLSIARCDTCKYWFCNGTAPGKSGSHIIHHLQKSNHKTLFGHKENPKHNGIFECEECHNKNCFNLQVTSNLQVLCRMCAIKSRFKNPDLTFTELIEQQKINSIKISGLNPEDSQKAEKASTQQIRKIEENLKSQRDPYQDIENENPVKDNQLRIKLRYDSLNDYYTIMSLLLDKDLNYNRKLKDELKIRELSLAMNDNGLGKFTFHSLDYGIKLSHGSYIELQIGSVYYNAVVVFIEDKTEIVHIKLIGRAGIISKGIYEFNLSVKFTEVPYVRMFDALFGFKDGYADPTLVNLILGKSLENPKVPINLTKKLKVPGIEPLNPSQKLCARNALTSSFSLIQGPPGTGKTHTLAAIVYHLVQNLDLDSKILVCSSSNVAVDNVVERIAKTGVKVIKICSRLREKIPSLIDAYCLHTKLKEYISKMHPEFISEYEAKAEYGENISQKSYKKYIKYTKDAISQIFIDVKVVCCTNVVAGDDRLGQFYYDTVLIDEANQATEPEILIPLLNGCSRFILAGDQMQLGPVTLCRSSLYGGLNRSLFTRLIDLGMEPNVLNIQYRMHPALSKFPTEFFYQSILIDGVNIEERKDQKLRTMIWPSSIPLIFIDHKSFEGNSGAGKSFVNSNEAFIVFECVKTLINAGIDSKRLVVLTPYDGQKRYIIEIMNEAKINIETCNIDEFQGKEMDYVIFSLVRSNEVGDLGFLNDFKRMNVAITRARYGMIIIGSSDVLARSKLWGHLIKHYSDNNLIFEGTFGRLRAKKVLVGELEPYNFVRAFPYADSLVDN